MRPSTSSRVSTTSRIIRPTKRVRVRPKDGGVCTRRQGAPIEEAIRRSKSSKESVSDPAASDTLFPALGSGSHCLIRQVAGVYGLDRVVAAPVNWEEREAPQRPGHVVHEQVAARQRSGSA